VDPTKPAEPKPPPPLSEAEKTALDELERIVEGKSKAATVIPFKRAETLY
jgi:hypothetical protein